MAQHPRSQSSSLSSPWEPEISPVCEMFIYASSETLADVYKITRCHNPKTIIDIFIAARTSYPTSNIPCNFSLFKYSVSSVGVIWHRIRSSEIVLCMRSFIECNRCCMCLVTIITVNFTTTKQLVFWMRCCSSHVPSVYHITRSLTGIQHPIYSVDLIRIISSDFLISTFKEKRIWKEYCTDFFPELFLTIGILQWRQSWFWLVLCVPIAWRWLIGLLCRYLSITINSCRD
jgi:hypothetical protein